MNYHTYFTQILDSYHIWVCLESPIEEVVSAAAVSITCSTAVAGNNAVALLSRVKLIEKNPFL